MITEKIGFYSFFLHGFRSAQLADPDKVLHDLRETFPGTDIQLLRADRVAGKEHLVFAAKNAIDSFNGRARRTKHLSMELLLFASGEHQIVEAIKLLGVTPSVTDIVLAGLSQTEPDTELFMNTLCQKVKGIPDDAVITFSPGKVVDLKNAYNITDREMESTRIPGETDEMLLKRLIIERSAMLVLEN